MENCKERRLQHREEAEKFYRDLAAQGIKVRVGMEASVLIYGPNDWTELDHLAFQALVRIP